MGASSLYIFGAGAKEEEDPIPPPERRIRNTLIFHLRKAGLNEEADPANKLELEVALCVKM